MSNQYFSGKKEPGIGRTIRKDIKNLKFRDDFSGEYKDLKEYFLSEERKEKAETMGLFKKNFIIPWWLLKALYYKLTPFRRFLLLIAILLLFVSTGGDSNANGVMSDGRLPGFISGLIFLFIIAVELKDKMYAKTELEEGRAVQKALTPDANPEIPNWDIWLYTAPANDVGGDLLDYINISDTKVGISLGDVAGKGLSAALLMAKLQSTIRAIVPDYKSLNELGKKINTIFCRDSLPRLFASLVFVELETDSSKIKLLNAGHLPPVVLRKNGIEKLKITSPALGIIPQASFIEQSIELRESEFLIIYSDGLTEARNEEGEFLGEDRLEKVILNISDKSSKEAGEHILNKIDQFKLKAKVHDDLTIAIIKRSTSL